jgi:TnpA family transposase
MPRRSILSITEKQSLIALLDNQAEFIRHYSFSESDLSIIRQRRGDANRLGFAIQLCYMRFPGIILGIKQTPYPHLLNYVAQQLNISPNAWESYGLREITRREHLIELQQRFGFQTFSHLNYQSYVNYLTELALDTDKGILLAEQFVNHLRSQRILLPAINTLEQICAESIIRANKELYERLTIDLTQTHLEKLDGLLQLKDGTKFTHLGWLRQSPLKPNSRHMLAHIDRLKYCLAFELPDGIERRIHQNRLLKIAREGSQMQPADLAKFESKRRYATLVALLVESKATIIDEIIDLHDRIIGRIFNQAKNRHRQVFHNAGKSINEKVKLYSLIGQALIQAKQQNVNPFDAIEHIISWEAFTQSVEDAQSLVQPNDFDFLPRIHDSYKTLRLYAPAMLNMLPLYATCGTESLLQAIGVLREMNQKSSRKLPDNPPTQFIKKRWQKLIHTDNGINVNYYELCVLSELKNALRSGDIWVQGSRQFKAFDEYLMTTNTFETLLQTKKLPIAIETDCKTYLQSRLNLLGAELKQTNKLAKDEELPEATIKATTGLKVTPLDAVLPESVQNLITKVSRMLPSIKITELLLEVDEWTGFSNQFTHLKTDETAKDKYLLLATILSDGINLGHSKMAESCPGVTESKLAWLQAWYIRDETYASALGVLTNAQLTNDFAHNWGDGTTSSSDGQRFKAGGRAQSTGHINPKYGSEPGRLVYTHVSDQYSPFHSKLINVGIRESTYVLDGLLYHESDLKVEEHYTDTAGFTDHVFALMHLLGFKFAPRIRDLGETKLFIPKGDNSYPMLKPIIGGTINTKVIEENWSAVLRLATSIKQGIATASLLVKKLGSYPRQNSLALALREIGRIERSLFILQWLQSKELRRRVQAGLNKGEARNALARAVFFNRLGEMRDHTFEHQRYRASGLNLITAAIVLWNTVYIERAVNALRQQGQVIDDGHLQYLSPLGWEHINLTGDYLWKSSVEVGNGKFRPLRHVNGF